MINPQFSVIEFIAASCVAVLSAICTGLVIMLRDVLNRRYERDVERPLEYLVDWCRFVAKIMGSAMDQKALDAHVFGITSEYPLAMAAARRWMPPDRAAASRVAKLIASQLYDINALQRSNIDERRKILTRLDASCKLLAEELMMTKKK